MTPRLAALAIFAAASLLVTPYALAQGPDPYGAWDLRWSNLHNPVSSDMPRLDFGTTRIEMDRPMAGECPPEATVIIRGFPLQPYGGGPMCLVTALNGWRASLVGVMAVLGLEFYVEDVFIAKGEALGSRADEFQGVGTRVVAAPPPPPPASAQVTLTISTTQIKASTTLTCKCKYEFYVDGVLRWSWFTGSSTTVWWTQPTGTHTVRVKVVGSNGTAEKTMTVTR